jgi:NAD-dependent dihydropyrimidine dehydrogenase PreA subunit
VAARKLTVVISQGQGLNPAKRQLEEELAARLIMDSSINVSIVPHLYDMSADHSGMLFLRSVPGDLVVLSWLYPRAARWTLDRQGVRGKEGTTLLVTDEDDEENPPEGIGSTDVPNRRIYCIDFRVRSKPEPFLEEIRRIGNDSTVQTVDLMSWITGTPSAPQLERYLKPVESPGVATPGATELSLLKIDEPPSARRWYPVIDYSRCTNCMECIDFCLFGVYGVDTVDRILVEAQDNCKKGCPACSRVCPANAIIFPQHKSAAIAGADGEVGSLKIDLSQLFGGASAVDQAVAERDAELVKDGREAVGATVGLPKRQAGLQDRPKDALDDLMDGLEQLEF